MSSFQEVVRQRCAVLGVSDHIVPHVIDRLVQLNETKAIATARPVDPTKTADISATQSKRRFASSQRSHARKAASDLDKEVGSFDRHITQLLRSYRNKNITKSRAETRAQIAFKETARKAYQLGMKSVGLVAPTGKLYKLDPSEQKWLNTYVREEFGYFKKFMAQAENLTSKQLAYRVGLYAAAMRSVYESGRVLSVGPNVLITWVLQHDKPCIDCQLLSKHNPYTANTLPTTPKAGSTRCRGNCRCELRIDKVTAKEVKQAEKRHKSSTWILRKIRQQQKKR